MPKPGKIIKIAIIIIILVFTLIYSSYVVLKLDQEQITSLIATGITTAIGLFIAVFQILSKKDTEGSNEQIKLIKDDVKELRNDFTETKKELSDVVFTITEKDLKDAEKDIIFMNGLRDMNEMMTAKKQIAELGKSIHKLSKKIISRTTSIDEPFNIFMVAVNDTVKEYVCTEYEYGLDLIDLEEYKILIKERIISIAAHSIADENKIKSVLFAINKNIDGYIDSLNGIQDISNGKRRKKFETKTLEFIEKNTYHSIEVYKQKQTA